MAHCACQVRVSGFRELPRTGDELLVVESEARAKEVVAYLKARAELEARAVQQGAAGEAGRAEGAEGGDGDGGGGGGSSKGEEEEVPWFRRRKPRGGRYSDDPLAPESDGVKLVPTVLKADSAGALEALAEGISHFPDNRVRLKVGLAPS